MGVGLSLLTFFQRLVCLAFLFSTNYIWVLSYIITCTFSVPPPPPPPPNIFAVTVMLDTQQTDINAAISENEVVIYHKYACLYYKYIYYTSMAINEKQLDDKYNYVTNLLFILQHPHPQ